MAATPPIVFPAIKSSLFPNAPSDSGLAFCLASPPYKGNFVVKLYSPQVTASIMMSPQDMKKFASQMIVAADMFMEKEDVAP